MVALSTSSVAAVCSLNTMKPVDTADDPSPSDRMFQANFPGAGHYDYYTHFTIVAVVRPSSQNLWMKCPKCDLWCVAATLRDYRPIQKQLRTYSGGCFLPTASKMAADTQPFYHGRPTAAPAVESPRAVPEMPCGTRGIGTRARERPPFGCDPATTRCPPSIDRLCIRPGSVPRLSAKKRASTTCCGVKSIPTKWIPHMLVGTPRWHEKRLLDPDFIEASPPRYGTGHCTH